MIYPAILETTLEETVTKAKIFEGTCDVVHIDIGDGDLVQLSSLFRPEDLLAKVNMRYQIHLMVNDPFIWVERKITEVTTVIFQAEPVENYLDTAAFFKNLGYKVGLSVNPQTPAPELFDNIDFVQFMSVEPGAQGGDFDNSVIDKILSFKSKYPSTKTQIDGGINEQNISKLANLGLSNFVIGSAILKAPEPLQKLKYFQEVVNV